MQEYERAVLEKYDMDVTGTRKTRGAILCDTDQGILLLKEVQGTAKRIPVLCGLYDALLGQGYENVDYIIRTKEGGMCGGDGRRRKVYFEALVCRAGM